MAAGDESPLDLGKFAEPAILVLVSLSDGPKHGYAIMSDVEGFSGTGMGPGTLYAVLARLERAGLIEPIPSQDRRRPYRMTPTGATALGRRLADLDRFVRVGRSRLHAPDRGQS